MQGKRGRSDQAWRFLRHTTRTDKPSKIRVAEPAVRFDFGPGFPLVNPCDERTKDMGSDRMVRPEAGKNLLARKFDAGATEVFETSR